MKQYPAMKQAYIKINGEVCMAFPAKELTEAEKEEVAEIVKTYRSTMNEKTLARAQEIVDKLPDCNEKKEMQESIDNVKKEIQKRLKDFPYLVKIYNNINGLYTTSRFIIKKYHKLYYLNKEHKINKQG